MSDEINIAGSLSTNRLTVNDPSHLHMLLGDPDADNTLEVGEIYLSTAEGWVELSGDGTGGVVVDLIDAPEGHTDE